MSKTARKNVADSTVYPERIDFRQAANPPKGISLARSETQSEAQRESPTGQLARACDRHWTPPFMPWFETDFQGSLRVRRLHRVARWIYGDLLRAGWHCDSAPYLPNDDEQLRTICDCPPGLWKKHRQAVIGCFIPTPDGKLLYHPKMVREYQRALSEHQRKVAGGKSRWGAPVTDVSGPQAHTHQHRELHVHKHVRRSA